MKLSGYTNPCLEFQYTYDDDIVSTALFLYVGVGAQVVSIVPTFPILVVGPTR